MPYCTKCGYKLNEDAKFCASCGAPVSAPPAPSVVGEIPAVGDVPTFTPPTTGGGDDVPVFTPPTTGGGDVPVFTPPTTGGGDVPVFTPPTAGGGDVPTFTPPGKKETPPSHFTPPKNDGPVCYYHSSEAAVAQCARCGKYICRDCTDAYGVCSGEYAGKSLCYDCTQQLVEENVTELTKNKATIKRKLIVSIVGAAIGFVLGAMGGVAGGFVGVLTLGLLCAAIGAVFLSALKAFGATIGDVIRVGKSGKSEFFVIGYLVARIFVLLFQCIFYSIYNTIYYLKYLKETAGFIESDQAAMQQMKDYMEYTLIRNKNPGMDINTLLREESVLADNSFAQMVQTQGEEQAEIQLRNCVGRINENGEIIRSFRENPKAAKTAA